MKLRNALLGAAVLAAMPLAAHAQIDGLYVGAGAGYNILQTLQTDFGNIGTKGGFAGLGSVGYGFGNGLRVELEGDYRNHGLKIPGSFKVNSYGAMVNALYDFKIDAPVTPYLGIGGGYQWTNIKGGEFSMTKGGLAAQAIAGLALPLDSVAPGLALTGEYRFLSVFGNRNYGEMIHRTNYDHTFLAGLRYAFGAAPAAAAPAPAPAPVAAPAPAPARTYLVFFDFDRADLNDRARGIIKDAASASTRTNVVKIEVNGHADLSGTPAYNQGLSQRRAQAVAAELVRDGVKKEVIDIHAYGDSRPLVPTARGVREPQNRRVEIIFR